jgi:plasmid stabilization system protein ParE
MPRRNGPWSRAALFPTRKPKKEWEMVQLIWTEPALIDLEAVADYIALDNLTTAKGLVQRISLHADQLQSQPESGSVVREPPNSS